MATVDAVARVATTTRDGATRATLVLGDGARVVRVEDVVRVEVRRGGGDDDATRDDDDDDDGGATLRVTAIAPHRAPPRMTRRRSRRKLRTHETACATATVAREARTRCARACGLERDGARAATRGEREARRRVLVIVNPRSGRGEGVKIWETKARAVFEAANIECETRTTKARGEATDVARGLDASLYDGIVAVGGDGTVAELFQGLSEREDREEIYAKMPIGIVPAGSGNALCKSIQHAGGEPCDPVSCALTIARWRTRALDRSEVRFRDSKTASGWGDDSKVTHSLLSTSWGFFSDVDIESERFRFLGGARFTLQAIVRILARRKYRCELLYETTEEGEAYNAQHCDGPHGEPVSGRPGWRRVAGDVLGLWALNVPWGTETTLAAPHAKFDDGSVDVVLVNVTNRKNMLKLLLDFDAGDHARNRAVRYIKAKSFEIYPGTAAAAAGTAAAAAAIVDPSSETNASAPGGGGYIAVDGEVLASRRFRGAAAAPFPYGPFRCDVVRAACAVFAPPRA